MMNQKKSSSWVSHWDHFWMNPCDLRMLAVVRRLYALLLVINLVFLWLDRLLFFNHESTLGASFLSPQLDMSSVRMWASDTPTMTSLSLGILMVSSVCLLIELWPRLAAATVFVLLANLQYSNQLILDGEDIVFRLFAFFLIFVPPRSDLELHQNEKSKHLFPIWPLRLFQLQMCLIFLCSAFQKTTGAAWVDGTAIYYVLRLDDLTGFHLPSFFTESLLLIQCATWSVVLFELSIPVLIWWQPARNWCLLLLVVFHLSTDIAMNLFLFHWIMLVGWLSFLPVECLDRLQIFPSASSQRTSKERWYRFIH
ncbi:MAG: hypothetical protein COA78_08675 [Blastopirellula sp.]|nr:MAG: hypothetical protein COA78_08675 [Blastopirellula sp.]